MGHLCCILSFPQHSRKRVATERIAGISPDVPQTGDSPCSPSHACWMCWSELNNRKKKLPSIQPTSFTSKQKENAEC